ncbi:hypothetical protein B9Z55_028759 [Caenorhabditis nigoni]|uniref:Serpentine receptor class gamma n=3 Tax=Caenorhabditis nigoni TaxID=1611254 RepID=A0A2G5SA61_9PELO|nr:hypothetical protein B9Z55_028759 [Caenorhabditis nigoni]
MDFFVLMFLFTLSYQIVGFVFYFVIAYVVWKFRKTAFKSSFFHLILLGFILNFTTFLNSFLSLRLPMFTKTTGFLAPFFLQFTKEHSQKWLCIPHALHFAFAYGQYNFNFGVCLNRWTIIKFNNFETRWKAYFWVFIVVTIGIPAALVVPILLNTSYYSQNEYWNTFYIDSTFGRKNIYMILTPYLAVVTGVNIYMNISSYRKMIELAKSGFSVPDKRFLVISFYVFTVDMFLTTLSVANCTILNFQPFTDNLTVLSWIAFCTPFASDVLTFCSPLLTFTMCHSVSVTASKMKRRNMVPAPDEVYPVPAVMSQTIGVSIFRENK